MLRERFIQQFEVIRPVYLEDSPCCYVLVVLKIMLRLKSHGRPSEVVRAVMLDGSLYLLRGPWDKLGQSCSELKENISKPIHGPWGRLCKSIIFARGKGVLTAMLRWQMTVYTCAHTHMRS